MSLESHIDALQKEHDRLDALIAAELRHSGSNDLELAQMKREKLHLKDEIARLTSRLYAQTG